MASFVRQTDFDGLVREYMQDGTTSLEDAVLEAIETFRDSGCDLGKIYIYHNAVEQGEKEKLDSRLQTLRQAGEGIESFVNANFAMQGIKQVLSASPDIPTTTNAWKFVASNDVVSTVIKLIPEVNDDADEDGMAEDVPDNDDDDDDDEDQKLATISVLDFLLFLYSAGVGGRLEPRDVNSLFSLQPESLQLVCRRLDEDIQEASVVTRMLAFLGVCLGQEGNREAFAALSGIDLMRLTAKMHPKNTSMHEQIAAVLSYFGEAL